MGRKQDENEAYGKAWGRGPGSGERWLGSAATVAEVGS